jgi:hypothetical protein
VYSRGFRTRDGFGDLYFTDALSANFGGQVNRRLSFSSVASWANSTLESNVGGGYGGQSASAQATYALNQLLAVYARYIYFHYRFDERILLDERFPRQLDRHGVRVGLTASLPLIR